LEYLFVREVRRPPVSGEDCLTEPLVRVLVYLDAVYRLRPAVGEKVGSPTSAAKVMISRSELGSRCIETLRKLPEPQAGRVP
jgi:hypothetical protein